LKGDTELALASLRSAYDKGFRQAWVLAIDVRLDALRNAPGFQDLRHDIEVEVRRARTEVRSQQVAML